MPGRILIYRFSSFGDVLIAIPVVMSALKTYPELSIVFVTRDRFVSYFPKHKRLSLIGLDLENEYKGLKGIFKAYMLLKSREKYELLIDLHNVIRSQLLNFLFRFEKISILKLEKRRRSKRNYISGKNRQVLSSTMELYLKVFEKAGYNFPLISVGKLYTSSKLSIKKSNHLLHIGLAPFARHATKSWPLENFAELISILKNDWDIQFYVFGAESEFQQASILNGPNVLNVCGTLSPSEEISIIRELDFMVSMDSANMHLADILGITVISIWGGTHPDLGFRPSFQSENTQISSPIQLDCRPCSVYGKESCKLKTDPFLCLKSIHAKQVTDLISFHLPKEH